MPVRHWTRGRMETSDAAAGPLRAGAKGRLQTDEVEHQTPDAPESALHLRDMRTSSRGARAMRTSRKSPLFACVVRLFELTE